ncbi:uncharacterized protein LOC121385798 [Gigantopelta aegis]|uniref:uncharacterized protein LOC121385798 n=1 Tax=Gigantopelta aegis TaxID=1735272 RepID=UPI001B8886E9|nr:uncharacterized protein LOC121385798 [Gigantopelta aegis]
MMNFQESIIGLTCAYLLLLAAVSSQNCEFSTLDYSRVFTDKSVQEDPLFTKTGIQSQSHCLHVCSRRYGRFCLGFVYNKNQQRCMGYNSRLEQLTQITEVGSVGFAAKSCPLPPSLPNGDAVYNSLLVGSVANYSCNKDYQFFGLSLSSVCEMSQSWNGLSGSCKRVAFYNISSPSQQNIPEIVVAGWKVEILGTPLADTRTSIDLRHQYNLPLLVIVNFQEGTVVRNSFLYNILGNEERTQPYFPFAVGIPFNLTILVKDSAFELYVNETFFVSRANNYSIALINQFSIMEGFLHSVKFIY